MTNSSTPDSPDREAPAGRVLFVMFRKITTAVFALTGAFTIGLVLVLALSAASQPDDDWGNGWQEEEVLRGGGLFPEGERRSTPATTTPRPPVVRNSIAVDVEYRADSADNRIEVRHDGRCEDDAYYAVDETDEEIRITAFTQNDSGCDRVEWMTVRLDRPVGDRVIVNAEAGLTARPVLQ